MIKRPYRAIWQVLVLALSLFYGDMSLYGYLSAADDSLRALEQEVILAKQKHQTYVHQVESADLALSRERSQELTNEAQRLIEELTQRQLSSPQPELAFDESARPALESPALIEGRVQEVSLTPSKPGPEPPPAPKPNKSSFFPNFGKWFSKSGDEAVDDGTAVYKVAVSDNKVTLKEAVDIGLANNLALNAAAKKIEVAQGKLTEAKRAMFPTAQGVWEFSHGLAGQVSSTDPHGRLYVGESRKINIDQPVFYGGELQLTVKQAEENLKSSRAEYEKNRGEFIHEVRTAYYGVVKAEYNLQYQIDLYQQVNELRRLARNEHEQKLMSEVDFLNVESQYQQVFFQVESAKNDLTSANLVLYQTLSLDDTLALPIDLRLRFNKVNPDFNQVLSIAMVNNADLKIKEYALVAAQYGLDIYKAKKLPRVDIRGSFGYLGEVNRDNLALLSGNSGLDLEREWFIGIKSSMPLGANSIEQETSKNVYGPTVLALTGSQVQKQRFTFNLLDKFSEITDERSAEATYLQAQSDYDKAQKDITLKIRDNFYNLQKSLIQIDSSIAKTRYQEKQNSIQEYLLRLQETSMGNYLEGIIEYVQDKFSFIQAVADYQLAVSDLSVAIGDPDYFERQSS